MKERKKERRKERQTDRERESESWVLPCSLAELDPQTLISTVNNTSALLHNPIGLRASQTLLCGTDRQTDRQTGRQADRPKNASLKE